ncbi:unnamed protein product [Enterobius vermicularis]|uniref:Secreted protein n=1 Tax=Enterobius vermicularis TaxID=51028 RepID=A0A0N4VA84_ENTVE|nr:unnamed protein product [Enterobius vermicularis]
MRNKDWEEVVMMVVAAVDDGNGSNPRRLIDLSMNPWVCCVCIAFAAWARQCEAFPAMHFAVFSSIKSMHLAVVEKRKKYTCRLQNFWLYFFPPQLSEHYEPPRSLLCCSTMELCGFHPCRTAALLLSMSVCMCYLHGHK